MINLLQESRRIAQQVMDNPQHVQIHEENVDKVAEELDPELFDMASSTRFSGNRDLVFAIILKNAVNFCYWYGKPGIRPGDASVWVLHDELLLSLDSEDSLFPWRIAQEFKKRLVKRRFPLIQKRIQNIDDILSGETSRMLSMLIDRRLSEEHLYEFLVEYPSYVEDIFLKRFSLLFRELYSELGLVREELIKQFPLPVDYHIPNVLRHLGLISYSDEISKKISNYTLIPSGSLEEIEIRSASLLVGDMICERDQRLYPLFLDELLWKRRHEPETPFHLTVTTDY